MDERRLLSTLIIRDLMLETLRNTNFCNEKSGGYDFFNSGGAHQDDLFTLVELMAIDKDLISKKVEVGKGAWGGPREQLISKGNTNFDKSEIEGLWEAFYILLNNHIIAPGMYRNSSMLPFFHVTEHGKVCVYAKDILPYDIDGYTKNLKDIENISEWVEFYALEALRCYNASCYNAATAMLGLAAEQLIELVICEFSKLIGKTRYSYKTKKSIQLKEGETLKEYFDNKIKKEITISKKYDVFSLTFEGIKNIQDELKILDKSARDSFCAFLRLNRNEAAHPVEVRKNETETLLLFVSFIKYCSLMTDMINKMKNLNEQNG